MAGKRKCQESVKKVRKEMKKDKPSVDEGKGKSATSNVEGSQERDVRIEHRSQTRYIVEANGLLRRTHQSRIEGTPFSWCLRMEKELNINCALIREVLSRWAPNGHFIRIRQHLVKLSSLDVSICLGLSAIGEEVIFDSDLCGEVGLLFPHNQINITNIIERIRVLVTEDLHVESVCRLYVLLCFAVLYFPRTSRTVCNMPFRLLDNLDDLHRYSWANSVHKFLISSLNRASKVFREKLNDHTIFVSGSVAVVQVWVARRLSIGEINGDLVFPRFLAWPVVKLRGDKIRKSFQRNQVVFDWGLSTEEENNPILSQQPAPAETNKKQHLKEMLNANERLLLQLKDELEQLKKEFYNSGGNEGCHADHNTGHDNISTVAEEHVIMSPSADLGEGHPNIHEGQEHGEGHHNHEGGFHTEPTVDAEPDTSPSPNVLGTCDIVGREVDADSANKDSHEELVIPEAAACVTRDSHGNATDTRSDAALVSEPKNLSTHDINVEESQHRTSNTDINKAGTYAAGSEVLNTKPATSEEGALINEALAFVAQQIGVLEAETSCQPQVASDEGEAFNSADANAAVDEEKDKLIGFPEQNSNELAIVPYVEPLDSGLQQCSPHVDKSFLYRVLTAKTKRCTYVQINGQILTSIETSGFRAREWIDNMSIFFAASHFMYKEKCLNGSIKRVIFSPTYTERVIHDCDKRKVNRHVWCLHDYNQYFASSILSLPDLLTAEFVLAPVLYDQHWWCYALHWQARKFYVLDSLGHKCRRRKQIDNNIARNLEHLFSLLCCPPLQERPSFEVIVEDLPQQPNLYDCGIMVLKYLQLWDGEKKYDGKSMPPYSTEELQQFRQDYICDWVLDPENIHRDRIVHAIEHKTFDFPSEE